MIGSPSRTLPRLLVPLVVAGAASLVPPLTSQHAPRLAKPVDHLDEPARGMVQLGERALTDGDPAAAREHFARALTHAPFAPAVLGGLLRAAPDDATRTVWAHAYAAAAGDARNARFKVDRALRKAFPKDPAIAKLAASRASAARELARWLAKLPTKGKAQAGQLGVATYGAHVLRTLTDRAPALRTEHGAAVDKAIAGFTPPYSEVLRTLRRVLDDALAAGDDATAGKAAFLLAGVRQQGGYDDLQGDGPKGSVPEGAAALAQIRQRVRENRGEPFTVEQLEAMSLAEQRAFSDEFGHEGNPAFALSRTGRYLVQTACGHEILLGVAQTIENHHDRLGGWFGTDPFENRQGLIRIVPDRAGLEAEGAPYWWAGGFQSGDVTTVQFACSTLEKLGRTLTHELTHRYDGVFYRFQPTWLTEGKAVWTGGAYRAIEDPTFKPFFIDPGRFVAAYNLGYSRPKKLRELLEGPKEYRDNYPAGFSLYTYLNTWLAGDDLLFESAFARYLNGFKRGPRPAVKWFEDCFCDGEEGRPASLDEFCEGFEEFLLGFDSEKPAEWEKRYRRYRGAQRSSGYLYDYNTWTWQRKRAEPFFGQDHAARIGDLFASLDRPADAALAWSWSLLVDEWAPHRARRFAAALDAVQQPTAAWVLRRRAGIAEGPLPALRSLSRMNAHLTMLRETATAYGEAGQAVAAAALASEHDRLASLLGVERVEPTLTDEERAPIDAFVLPERLLGSVGWREDDLLDYDSHRDQGLWFEATNRDLHVGRKELAETTGLERKSPRRELFLRAGEWLPAGRYELDTRVYFTTAFVEGALVVGHTRRDRALIVEFEAGDWEFAAGRTKEKPSWSSVQIKLDSRFVRDAHLADSLPNTSHSFDTPKPSFALRAVVDGPTLRVFVEDELVFDYHTPDGLPIEGHVGFAAKRGAYRVQTPTLRALDWGLAGNPPGVPAALDLTVVGDGRELRDFRHRPCRGVPVAEQGTLLVVVPEGQREGETYVFAMRSIRALASAIRDADVRQALAFAVPKSLTDEQLAELKSSAQETFANRAASPPIFVRHARAMDEGLPIIAFIDALGTIRVTRDFPPVPDKFFNRALAHWCRAYRAP